MTSLNCKKAVNQLSNYLDGELEEELKKTIEAHLGKCRHCHAVFDTTRRTIELYCDGKLFPLPDDVRARLHEALRRRAQRV
jgi:predicted anti-sigma-YlaC factor YlaD